MSGNTEFEGLPKMRVYYHPLDQTLETDLETGKEIREVTKTDNIIILGHVNYSHIH